MARKTIKIAVSSVDSAALVKLASKIASRQASENADQSLAVAVDWTWFNASAAQAKTWQDQIDDLTRQLEELTGKRDNLVGKAEGQTTQSTGTLLFEVLRIRDILLGVARGNEKALEPWGFDVTVGEAKLPTRKAKVNPA